ncbi:MAG: DUF3047 domain-containing protein [Burkholderiales bacterium]|nr:DUF3047 domain-containing protein [Burkholderiales bacterium]
MKRVGAMGISQISYGRISRLLGQRAARVGAVAMALALAGCQTAPSGRDGVDPVTYASSDADAAAVYAAGTQVLFPGWDLRRLPGKSWAPFTPVEVDGQPGLQVKATSSLSLLRKQLPAPRTEPLEVWFSWWVENLIDGADLSDTGASDAPAQLLVAFDGDRSLLSARNAMMSELLLLVTGEEMPYASMVYVWANEHPVGTVIRDPRSDRIRYLVVEQGDQHLRQWVHHRRDIHADYRQVFGEEPGPVVGLAIMTDTDNTRTQARGVFGPVSLRAIDSKK